MDDGNPFRKKPETTEEYLEDMWDTLQELLGEAKQTNGRVTALEEWRQDYERKRRETEAYQTGVMEAPLWSRRHWRVVTAAVLGTGGLAGLIAAVAPILVGRFWH